MGNNLGKGVAGSDTSEESISGSIGVCTRRALAVGGPSFEMSWPEPFLFFFLVHAYLRKQAHLSVIEEDATALRLSFLFTELVSLFSPPFALDELALLQSS